MLNPTRSILAFVNTFQLETGTAPDGATIAAAIDSAKVGEYLARLVQDEMLIKSPQNVYAVSYAGFYYLQMLNEQPLPSPEPYQPLQLDPVAIKDAQNQSAYIRFLFTPTEPQPEPGVIRRAIWGNYID